MPTLSVRDRHSSFPIKEATVDDKGRIDPETMEDRELLIELVFSIREFGDFLQNLGDAIGKSPLGSMMPGLKL